MRKLLVIGAEGHGKVVAEVVQDCGYEEIAIDDNSTNVIGKTYEIEIFAEQYVESFVGIGNNGAIVNAGTLVENGRK